MKEWFRYIATFFGVRYVVLISHRGERHVRRVLFRGGEPYAAYHDFDITNIDLLDNGGVRGAPFVVAWEPYYPLRQRRWPQYEERI